MDYMRDPRWQMGAWLEVVEKYARPHPPGVAIAQVNTLMLGVLAEVRAWWCRACAIMR